MKKFSNWLRDHDVKQRSLARKIGVSTTHLWEIARKDKIPSLKTAYEIEKYTKGEITLYDWLDQNVVENEEAMSKSKSKPKKF